MQIEPDLTTLSQMLDSGSLELNRGQRYASQSDEAQRGETVRLIRYRELLNSDVLQPKTLEIVPPSDLVNKHVVTITPNDVIITLHGISSGKAVAVESTCKVLMKSRIAIIRCLGVHAGYLAYHINSEASQSFLEGVTKTGESTKLRYLSRRDLLNLPISLPSLARQRSVFTALNRTSREVSHFLASAASLQAKAMRIRTAHRNSTFKSLEQKGDARYIGEICESLNAGPALRHQKTTADGKYIVVDSRFISDDGAKIKKTDEPAKLLSKNDIVVTLALQQLGAKPLKCMFIKENDQYALGMGVIGLRAKSVRPDFLYHLLNENPVLLHSLRNTRYSISRGALLKSQVNIPHEHLQAEVADLLNMADADIELIIQRTDVQRNSIVSKLDELIKQPFRPHKSQ